MRPHRDFVASLRFLGATAGKGVISTMTLDSLKGFNLRYVNGVKSPYKMPTQNGGYDDNAAYEAADPGEIFISCSLRWPYHANVMNTFDSTSISMVQIPCMTGVF